MHYIVKYSSALLLIVLLFSSCRKEPQYSDAPEIEFRGIEKYSYQVNGVRRDSLVLVIGYKDGDGNLGLSEDIEEDSRAPFNFGSPYYNNFVLKFYEGVEQSSGQMAFVPFRGGFQLAERFPRISTDERVEPLEGDIKYSYVASEDLISPGTVLRFEAQIFDRALPTPNASNMAMSEPVVLFEN